MKTHLVEFRVLFEVKTDEPVPTEHLRQVLLDGIDRANAEGFLTPPYTPEAEVTEHSVSHISTKEI